MADELSWEDIFNPKPASPAPPKDPAGQSYTPLTPTDDYRSAGAAVRDPFESMFGSAPSQRAESAPAPEYTPDAPFPVTAAARFTPRDNDDPFAAIFGGAAAATGATPAPAGNAPMSRREARELEARQGESDSGTLAERLSAGRGNGGAGGFDGSGGSGGKPRKKRRLLWLKITLPLVLVFGAAGGVGAYGWFNYNTQVRALLNIPLPIDFTGTGNGEQVVITIQSGDIGSDIARTLHDKGVTMTFDAFYELLLEQKTQPNFQPGNYSLQKEMSAQSALDALLNPDKKITDRLLITEGTTLPKALEIIAQTTGISLVSLQTASKDLASFGLPAAAPSLEGYLFPATYRLDGGLKARDVLKLLVDTTFARLDKAGVAPADRHKVLTMAALIQREAGPNKDDFYKISRVFQNRLEQGMNLESDATVHYGTGDFKTVWTTNAERADASNLYNTYARPGLPVGPIGLPGDLAIDAALRPAVGPWLFFVTINLATGETAFSETVNQHEAAVQKLRKWCAASAENDAYCQ
jgi:UPF0755 protein